MGKVLISYKTWLSRGIAVLVIVLIIALAFTPCINSRINFDEYDKSNILPNGSDLECWGNLTWTNVEPGETVHGRFYVRNGGSTGDLYWEIAEWPAWGIWDFGSYFPKIPPGGHWIAFVNVTAPNQGNQSYTGYVKVINKYNASDYGIINASLETGESVLIEITTEVYGLPGQRPQTIQLTKEDVEAVDILFEEIKFKLDDVETRDEAVEIFNEAITELDKYGLLGGLSVEQAKRLVTERFRDSRIIKVLEGICSRNQKNLEGNVNVLCLIAGKIEIVHFVSLLNWFYTNLMIYLNITGPLANYI
jgi:hypothetical protein